MLLKVVKNCNCVDDVLLCVYSDVNEFDIREFRGFIVIFLCDLVFYW